MGTAVKKTNKSSLSLSVVRLARMHFLYVIALGVQIIFYHSWDLITLDTVLQRWVITLMLLVVTSVVWYLAKTRAITYNGSRRLVYALILIDIAVASFGVYTQRGMASRAVFLYLIPIIVSAILMTRAALLATAACCVAAYVGTAVAYFALNFNEGYKIELYGEIGFYSAMFFVAAGLLWVIIRGKQTNS